MHRISRFAAAILLVLSARAANAQNVVMNGGFEQPDVSDYGFTSVFPGWDTFHNSVASFDSGLGNWGAHSGTQYLSFICFSYQCDTSQILGTTPGLTYTFSFWYASDGAPSNEFSASWDYGAASTLFHVRNDVSHDYQLHSFSVVAKGSDLIYFFGTGGSDYLQLDDVCVSADGTCPVAESAAPEPASFMLFATGLLGVGIVRRRRIAS